MFSNAADLSAKLKRIMETGKGTAYLLRAMSLISWSNRFDPSLYCGDYHGS